MKKTKVRVTNLANRIKNIDNNIVSCRRLIKGTLNPVIGYYSILEHEVNYLPYLIKFMDLYGASLKTFSESSCLDNIECLISSNSFVGMKEIFDIIRELYSLIYFYQKQCDYYKKNLKENGTLNNNNNASFYYYKQARNDMEGLNNVIEDFLAVVFEGIKTEYVLCSEEPFRRNETFSVKK